ncbi:MAG TPA: metalloregulator ArsR/SmtB family transcription factor [Acidimicrobiales bacterium]|nr:metalloregulator ArsR/SmtB family transcription factor [Acidimicrobiales bacterium]
MARASTTADVFNAIAEVHRREILDVLIAGEKPVGAIVDELAISQPQVSKHLRVLSEVGLVRSRAVGRRRLYRLDPTSLRPVGDWVAKYEQLWNERLDRLDDYLSELQRRDGQSDQRSQGAPGR